MDNDIQPWTGYSRSYPIQSIARHFDLDYGDALSCYDGLFLKQPSRAVERAAVDAVLDQLGPDRFEGLALTFEHGRAAGVLH